MADDKNKTIDVSVKGYGTVQVPANLDDAGIRDYIRQNVLQKPRDVAPPGARNEPAKPEQMHLQPENIDPQLHTDNYPQSHLTKGDVKGLAVSAIPMVTGAAGAWAGGIPGAAAGGAVGEAVKQGIVSKYGAENLSGPTFKTDAPPGTAAQSRESIIESGFEQGAFEGAGRVGGKLVRGLIGGPMNAEGRAMENATLKEVNKTYGLNLTAPEIANKGRALMQRPGEYSLFSQAYIKNKWGQGTANGIEAINNVLRRLSPASSPVEAGKAVQGVFKLSSDLYKEEAGNLYSQLDQATKGTLIDVTGTKHDAQLILDKIAAAKKEYPNVGGIGKAEKLLTDFVKGNNQVPFGVAQSVRSNLMEVSPQAEELMAGKAPGVAKKLVGSLTADIDNSLSASNPQAQKLWKQARQFYKDGAEIFDHATIQGLMNKDPVAVATSIKPNDTDMAERIRKAILDYPLKYGDPSQKQEAKLAWKQFQEQFARSNILADPEHVMGKADPQELGKLPDRMKAIGPGVLKEIYSVNPEGRQALENLDAIGRSFERVNALPTEQRRLTYEALGLIASVAGGVSSHSIGAGVGGAAAVEGFPLLISMTIHSPKATGYLLDGIGGFIESFKNSAAKRTGKALIKLQEKTVTSPTSYKELGPAMSNIMRAYELVQSDRENMEKQRQKSNVGDSGKEKDQAKGITPPKEGDPIKLMLNEWQ